MTKDKRGSDGVALRRLCVSVTVLLLAVLVVWLAGNSPAAGSDQAWGDETVHNLQAGLREISPIALANACGLGASSCFKCHNGKRAGSPNSDSAKSPWHTQHATVNFSCAGCHQGNPRLMKDELAHAGLIKAPRSGDEACGHCHQGDRTRLEATYKSIGGK